MICLLVAALISGRVTADAEQILRRWSREVRSQEFVKPSAKEFTRMRDLTRLSLGDDATNALEGLRSLGFRMDRLLIADETFGVLREDAEPQGGGFYAFRADKADQQRARSVVLQAPHAYYDRGTGKLARRVFVASGARGLCLNTAQRHVTPDADVAHTRLTHFQAVTEAMCAEWPDTAVLQIHGYAREKHGELSDAVSAVLSDGSDVVGKSTLIARVADGLAAILGPDSVAIYPRDTHAFGAPGATHPPSH